jgi:hypothetical protein
VSWTSAARPDECHLKLGDYTADIVISNREEHCCYYVIQRTGSAEILELQRYENRNDAEAAAHAALKRWNRECGSRHAAS